MNAFTIDTLINEVNTTLSRQGNWFQVDERTLEAMTLLKSATDIITALDCYNGVCDCLGDVGVYLRSPFGMTSDGFQQTNVAQFIIQSAENFTTVDNAVTMVRRQLRQERESYGFESDINVICINSAVDALNHMEYELDTVLNM